MGRKTQCGVFCRVSRETVRPLRTIYASGNEQEVWPIMEDYGHRVILSSKAGIKMLTKMPLTQAENAPQ
jgi:hypothetical protein